VCWSLAVLAEVALEENKARLGKRAWEWKKPGDVRLLSLLLSLFLCWHVFPFLVWMSLRFALDGEELWPTKLTPQYVVARGPFVKRNLHFLFARAKTRTGLLGRRRWADSCLAFREAGPTWKTAAKGDAVTS